MMISKRAVLVTGASTGIGRACALHLDGLGFRVYAGVRRDADGAALRESASDKLLPVTLDVTETDTIRSVIEQISLEPEFPLYGLVNNAGVGISGVLEATPVSEFRKLLEVNLIGLHAVTGACLPLLRSSVGRIVNIGSSASFMAGPGASSYAASKFAVRAISDSLRLELYPTGMSVSLVAPGAVESEIWDKARVYKKEFRKTVSPEVRKAYDLFIRAGERMADSMNPIPAIEVAKAVAHGLTSRKPRPVYLVGPDARKARFFAKLPAGLLNWLVIKHITRIAGTPVE